MAKGGSFDLRERSAGNSRQAENLSMGAFEPEGVPMRYRKSG